MKAYVMRHCLTDLGPQMDPDRTLDDVGIAQAHVMRKFLKRVEVHPDLIISSDFARAHDTAKIMQRDDTPLITTKLLRPDGDQSKAWKFIAQQAKKLKKNPDDGQPAVLIVTHSPLIYSLWAAISIPAFVDENWQFHHGAIGYCNTTEARFRWYVNPKLAAHVVKKNPKKVENPLGEALVDHSTPEYLAWREWFWNEVKGGAVHRVAENLMADARRSTIEPLRNQMRTAITMRWTKQLRRVKKAMRRHTAVDPTATAAALAQVIPFHDAFFLRHHNRIKADAYRAGAQHAGAQLGVEVGGAVQGIEAAPVRKPRIPTPGASGIDADGRQLETELDNTTVDRAHKALHDLDPFTLAGALGAMTTLFNGFTDPESGKLSRADTVALQTVSDGYHAGGKDTAGEVSDAGSTVEKQWDIGAEGCPICQDNAAEGWIGVDEVHASGDDEPPAHPNCDCSEIYRTVPDAES
jgi:phosphohistidine phosphatase SixA